MFCAELFNLDLGARLTLKEKSRNLLQNQISIYRLKGYITFKLFEE